MTDWVLLGQFALTMLAAQFSPGPDMLLLLKNAVNHPLRAGLFTVVGIAVGLLIHTLVACLGLSAAFAANPVAFRIFTWCGAVYLVYVAMRLLVSLRSIPVEPNGMSASGEHPLADADAFRQGFLTNITNAKAFLFLASFIAAGLKDDSSASRKLALGGIIVVQAVIFWSLFVWLLKRPVVRSAYIRAERSLNFIFAMLLIAIAIQVAFG